jgi:hypothetical protein
MIWAEIWQILGPILGGLIAAAAGLGVYFSLRSANNLKAKRDYRQRLKSLLISYENEIKRNISLLEQELSDEGEYVEYLQTKSRDVMLYTLGEIPLEEATHTMRYVVESYTIFDEANHMLEQIESMMEHNTDARGIYAKRSEFVKAKLNILKWDLAQIHKVMEDIKARVPESNLS